MRGHLEDLRRKRRDLDSYIATIEGKLAAMEATP